MKIITLSAFIALGISACGTSSDKSTAADTTTMTNDSTVTTEVKTETLFDGSTLNGWHSYGKSEPGNAWNVDSGTIHLNAASKKAHQANGSGDLVSNDEYENFDLQLDWKISKNGNSGIIFYVHEDTSKYKETYNTGLEMQVLDNDGHPDGKIPKHRAANLYDLIAASPENVKGPGAWNHAEIIANKGQLELYLNGEKVVSTTLWNDDWKKMIAGSKFKDMPDWGTFTKGHIALQNHGNDVWYKNITIKRL